MTHFNQMALQWDTEEKINLYRHYGETIRSTLSDKQNLRLLDVGCGTGLLAFQFVDKAKEIMGIDMSSGMLNVFEEKASVQRSAGGIQAHSMNLDLDHFDLDKNSQFDLMVSAMAFHHFDNPVGIVQKLYRHLADGGQMSFIDLCTEDGSFHGDNVKMGVKHFGFSQAQVENWWHGLDVGVKKFSVIHEVKKNGKTYPIFLATVLKTFSR